MHPIIAVCILLMVAGAVMALRWGHLAVEPPWTVDPEAEVPAPERLRRVLWYAAIFLYGAVISGLTVLGPGGRLVMRLLAVTAGEEAQGRVTEAEEIVGRITVDGTRVQLRLEPGIRDLATRRLTGCLGDATLPSVRARVVAVRHVAPS